MLWWKSSKLIGVKKSFPNSSDGVRSSCAGADGADAGVVLLSGRMEAKLNREMLLMDGPRVWREELSTAGVGALFVMLLKDLYQVSTTHTSIKIRTSFPPDPTGGDPLDLSAM